MSLDFLDPREIIHVGGILLITAIVFAESGLLVGFFLPGDSLLFMAGVIASPANVLGDAFHLNIWILLPCVFVAAVAGDSVGYWFGDKVGPRLFRKPDSRLFRKDHLLKAEAFYEKHGPKTIVIARFIPIVRTFAPIVAGIGSMHYRTFLVYNLVGGFIWTFGVTLAGYFLGSVIGDDIEAYLYPLIALIIVISIMPPLIEFIKHKRSKSVQSGLVEQEESSPKELKDREPGNDGVRAHAK